MCRRLSVIGGLLMVLLGPGCRARRVDYPADLVAPDSAMRIRAVQIAGNRRDRRVVPLLVDRLEDEDSAVRFYAVEALHKITGTDYGYHYYKPAPERAKAVERWRRCILKKRTESSPGTAKPGETSANGTSNADRSQ